MRNRICLLVLALLLCVEECSSKRRYKCYICNDCPIEFEEEEMPIAENCAYCSVGKTYRNDVVKRVVRECLDYCNDYSSTLNYKKLTKRCCTGNYCNQSALIRTTWLATASIAAFISVFNFFY